MIEQRDLGGGRDVTARLEWVTVGSGLLGDIVRVPRFMIGGPTGSSRVVLVSGFRTDDVLGPEVLRTLYKEAGERDIGCRAVGWPVLPARYSGGTGQGGRETGLSERVDEVIADSCLGADAVIHLGSPEQTEAYPYAVVPPAEIFPSEWTFERSVTVAAALGTVYTVGEQPLSPLGLAAARSGIPCVQVIAGERLTTTRELRNDLRKRLGWMLDAVVGETGGPVGVPGRIHTVQASEAGFLHRRASLGDEVSPDHAVAATWAFEPDLVEEFFLDSGRVIELSRKGRVDVGDVVARSATLLE